MAEDGSKRRPTTVCVTGGTGYLASWLVFKLLQNGYCVNTTVRASPGREKDISYLTNLPGAPERLRIFNADLDKPDSFNPAIEGCIGVFHVCHPMEFEGKETEEEITKRSINGTLGILQACLNSKTVKKVVYTSSVATIVYDEGGNKVNSDMVVDENAWSDVDYIRSLNRFGAVYSISKTLTEKVCLEFAEKYGLDLVTVLPTWIHGPFLTPNLPGSLQASMSMILGSPLPWNVLNIRFVHVDDVARAHIFLLEYPNAKGRYICSALEIPTQKLREFLSSRYPQYHHQILSSSDHSKDAEIIKYPLVSSKKLLETGFEYKYGLEEMFDDAIRCCKEKGFL